MICPYIVEKHEYMEQKYIEQTDTDDTTKNLKSVETRQMMKCAEHNCGAWKDGHCGYVGAVK